MRKSGSVQFTALISKENIDFMRFSGSWTEGLGKATCAAKSCVQLCNFLLTK